MHCLTHDIKDRFLCVDLVCINIPCELPEPPPEPPPPGECDPEPPPEPEPPACCYYLDDLGISLADAAKQSDERYVTGRKLVECKILQAKVDVFHHLLRNIDKCAPCDLDNMEETVCCYADVVAKAIYYRAAGLLYKDLILDSSRYNNYVAYSKDNALASALLYDSSYQLLAIMSGITEGLPAGMYQKTLEELEPLRTKLEQLCCIECVGSRYQYVIP